MSNLYSPIFFGTFLQIAFLFVLIYLLGHVALSFFRIKPQNDNVSLFTKLFVGLVFGVTSYAIIKTQFNTIQIISLVIGGYFLLSSKKNSFREIKQKLFIVEYKQVLCLIFLLFGFYFLAYYQYYISSKGEVFGDFHFYSSVAYVLKTTGVETNNLDWTLSSLSPTPYHYFTHWFVALSSFIFSNTTLLSFYLFFVPIFGTIIFQGALSIACLVLDNKNKYTYILCFVLGFLFLILQNIYIPFIEIPFLIPWIGSWFYNIKLSIVFILFAMIVIALIKKEYKVAFALNLLSIPLYSTLAPAVLSGSFFLLTYLVLKKQIIPKHYWLHIATLVGIAVFYGLFYWLQRNDISSSGQGIMSITPSGLLSHTFLTARGFARLFVFGLMPTAVLFLCLFLYKKKIDFKNLRKTISNNFICLFIYIASALFTLFLFIPVFFYFNHDAFQLLINFIDPIFIFVVFVLILKFIKITAYKMLFTLCITIFYIGLFINNPSIDFYMRNVSMYEFSADDEYFENISLAIKQNPEARFAYFRNYENRHLMEFKPFLFVPDNGIAHFTSSYIPMGLSVFEIPDTIDTRYVRRDQFAFYRYAKNTENLSKKMLSFIRLHNIKFVIIEYGATYPQEIIKHSYTIFVNRKNQNRFVVLDLESL